MAAPGKLVKKIGKWKRVRLDPNLYANPDFENLVSFSELSSYEIVDEENNCTSSEGAEHFKANVKVAAPSNKASHDKKSDIRTSSIKTNRRKKKLKLKSGLTDHSSDDKSSSERLPCSGIASSERICSSVKDEKKSLQHSSENATKIQAKRKGNITSPERTVLSNGCKRKNKLSSREKVKKITRYDNVYSSAISGNVTESVDMKTWQGLFVPSPILKGLAELGFKSPMPIQALCLPAAIRDNRDIMGAAETGSGKTLAFGIPMLHYILKWKDHNRKVSKNQDSKEENSEDGSPLLGLVLTPTRELAVQVKSHISAAAKYTDIQTLALVGGLSTQKQHRLLKRHPEIIVATPGRLWELIELGETHLNLLDELQCLVIDEADRMIEKGHYQELTKLFDLLNQNTEATKRRRTYVFSATLTIPHLGVSNDRKKKTNADSNQLETLMNRVGIKANAKIVDLTNKTVVAGTLVEARINCTLQEKDLYLFYFLKNYRGRTLVFTNSKDCIRRLVSLFTLLDCSPLPLHADMHQKQRLKNLERFTGNENVLLVATDVAARGLDIPDVQHVIHYQVPRTVENYVHRSGRTARANKEGVSVMLVGSEDARNYRKIVLHTRGEDLPTFPVEYSSLAKMKPIVTLSRDIDSLEHRTSKMKRENDWFTKLAKDADIELEEESDILYNFGSKDAERVKKKLKSMKSQLSQMLKQRVCTKGVVSKYPTEMAAIRPTILSPVTNVDAVSQIKRKREMRDTRPNEPSGHVSKRRKSAAKSKNRLKRKKFSKYKKL